MHAFMICDDLKLCTRPVLFENQSEEYPYTLRGSAFLVRFNKQLFVLTSGHQLKEYTGDELLISYAPEPALFLPICELSIPCTQDPLDTDLYDLRIFRVAQNETFKSDKFDQRHPYDLDCEPCMVDLDLEEAKTLVIGYPFFQNKIDFDNKRLIFKRLILSGVDVGQGEYRFTRQIEFDDLNEVLSLNGMSGAPVFLLWVHNSKYIVQLGGMMIREKYYLTAEALRGYLSKVG